MMGNPNQYQVVCPRKSWVSAIIEDMPHQESMLFWSENLQIPMTGMLSRSVMLWVLRSAISRVRLQ